MKPKSSAGRRRGLPLRHVARAHGGEALLAKARVANEHDALLVAAGQRRDGIGGPADLDREFPDPVVDEPAFGRLERRIAKSKVLVIDELGFVPFDREGGELLFNLLSGRHRSTSTVITSNLPFSEWTKVFGGDEKLTAALLDRLAENAVVIATKGTSYRTRRQRKE